MQFMLDPLTREAGKAMGLRGRPLYYCGRGGALGDVSAELVIAAMGFFAPEVVREHWEAGREVMPASAVARAYAAMCNDWGRRNLDGKPGLERTAELLTKVIESAEPMGLALFVAWRSMPLPDDLPGRVAQLINVMREHRGAAHVAAVAAVGLAPLPATMAGSYGAASAKFAEWPEPWPDPEPYRAAWQQAEELTSQAAATPYAVLTEAERAELVELLTTLHAGVLVSPRP